MLPYIAHMDPMGNTNPPQNNYWDKQIKSDKPWWNSWYIEAPDIRRWPPRVALRAGYHNHAGTPENGTFGELHMVMYSGAPNTGGAWGWKGLEAQDDKLHRCGLLISSRSPEVRTTLTGHRTYRFPHNFPAARHDCSAAPHPLCGYSQSSRG